MKRSKLNSLASKKARTKLVYETVQKTSVEMVNLQRRLADAGLYATMHAVNKASQKLGWEAVELLKKLAGSDYCRFHDARGLKCKRTLRHPGAHRV